MSETLERRVLVNPVLCTGFGYCAEIVPELITLDDWGFPIVNSRPIKDERVSNLAHRAVVTCPRLALLLVEADPNHSDRP
ncbi:MAG TPA: ferredoxin [Candidatus Micrarchaeaceae archaeon]|nr:ferredoxin [Candidatus Micrarchaeaceae archaeon]